MLSLAAFELYFMMEIAETPGIAPVELFFACFIIANVTVAAVLFLAELCCTKGAPFLGILRIKLDLGFLF